MLTPCPCGNCYLTYATWKVFTASEKQARNLTGDTDHQITSRKCECRTQYSARPLTTTSNTRFQL